MAENSRNGFDQAGAIPYRANANGWEVLLISSRTGRRWIFPKGDIADGETARACAAREAFEEAGIEGRVQRHPLGGYAYRKNGRSHAVAMFLLEVARQHDDWPEDRLRKRRWVTPQQAMDRLGDAALKRLLDCAGRELPVPQPA